jgi:perosamine synthetase
VNEAIAFSRPFFGEAEAEAAAAAVRSGWVVGGPRLAEFEQCFAALCGAEHAVGVSSWTTGAFLVLHAWNIGPGDEVIVPSLTFIATVNVIRHVGATPVFFRNRSFEIVGNSLALRQEVNKRDRLS